MKKRKKRKRTPRSQVPCDGEKVHERGQVWLLQERGRLLGEEAGKEGARVGPVHWPPRVKARPHQTDKLPRTP